MAQKTNVIFLDFDGTVFPRRFFITKTTADPVVVQIVNTLCEHYNFRIVISSTMREQGKDVCAATLDSAGIDSKYLFDPDWDIGNIQAYTEISDAPRFKRIKHWLHLHKESVGVFLIFDDERPRLPEFYDACYFFDDETGIPHFLVTELFSKYPKIMEGHTEK